MAEQAPVTGTDDNLVNGGDDQSPGREPEVIVLSDSETSDCESDKNDEEEQKKNLECPVCIQQCVHPARLPCGHIFCFLCVKGIAHASKRCAMCRHPIPPDFLENPDLVYSETVQPEETTGETFQWYYEGRNGGWWQYEERMSDELERMRRFGNTRFETLICGMIYVMDLLEFVQYRKDRPGQRRRILRDVPSRVVKKGWWQYDQRACLELETAYQAGEPTCELLIAGYLYTVDFTEMLQSRRSEPARRRKIKRDLSSCPKKGVAGLRQPQTSALNDISAEMAKLSLNLPQL